MSDNVFVDTNILVYARDAAYPEKQTAAERWMRELWEKETGRTSFQVLNEYFVTVTYKLTPGLIPERAWEDVRDLMAWEPQAMNRPCLELARHLSLRYSFSWWDSLVVSAAQLQHCTVLLTEDMQDGMMIDEMRIVNPFS